MKAGKILVLSDNLSQRFIDSCKDPDDVIQNDLVEYIEDFIYAADEKEGISVDEIKKLLNTNDNEAQRIIVYAQQRDVLKFGIDPKIIKNNDLITPIKKEDFYSIRQWFELFEKHGGKNIYDVLEGVVNRIEKIVSKKASDKIDMLWRMLTTNKTTLRDSVYDLESEFKFIEAVAKQFSFPNYQLLVSEPSPKNWVHEEGKAYLKTERKAELLLIGEFEWNGLIIAKSKPLGLSDSKGWLVNLDQDYKPNTSYKKLCQYKFYYRSRKVMPTDSDCRFIPFKKNTHVMPLVSYLYHEKITQLGKDRAVFIDFNHYNLSGKNIEFKSSKGRRMRCSRCKREVVDKNSTIIAKQRVCGECLVGKHNTSMLLKII